MDLSLFYFDPAQFFLGGKLPLGKFYFQNAVVVGGVDVTRFHIVYAETPGVGTVIPLPADVFVLGVLVFLFLVFLFLLLFFLKLFVDSL